MEFYNQDEEGIIDIEQIHNENGATSNYFISGPPIMIKSFEQSLLANGVPPTGILADDWE